MRRATQRSEEFLEFEAQVEERMFSAYDSLVRLPIIGTRGEEGEVRR